MKMSLTNLMGFKEEEIVRIEAVIDRVSVDIDVPDCCEGQLTMDDIRTMISEALRHNYLHQVVQLVIKDMNQWNGEFGSGKEVPVEAGVWIDVDWDSIDVPGFNDDE